MKKIYLIITLIWLSASPLFAQTPYLGEIRAISFNYAPHGWALCNGQLLPINQNQALFSILGTTYGGNGTTTFALPDLRGRVIVGQGPNKVIGQTGGTETTSLTLNNLPAHSHLEVVKVSSAPATQNVATPGASIAAPVEVVNGTSHPVMGYNTSAPNVSLAGTPTSTAGSASVTPVSNMQPTLGLNYIISLQGIFPSQN